LYIQIVRYDLEFEIEIMKDEQEAITKLNNSSTLPWKPLNVITLDLRDTDNINQMITIAKYTTKIYKTV
jgi:hypothetical protein